MKAIKILTMAALATAVFASCSSEDELAQSNYPMDNVVRIMTSVDGMNTRASYGNSTDKLNSFGFCINNANSTTYTYDNVKVTKEGSNWNPATQMLWQNSTTAVDILAMRHIRRLPKMQMAKLKSSEIMITLLLYRQTKAMLMTILQTSLFIDKRTSLLVRN